MQPPREVIDYYTHFAEESRLGVGSSQLEFERTKELLRRVLPAPPADVADIGGAAGAYAFWLAGLGYSVHLVDATPRLVEEARRRNADAAQLLASIAVGDGRRLPLPDASVDVVLLFGPLYHLPDRPDRAAALLEARRVLRRQGLIVVSAISRYAGTLDGVAFNPGLEPHVAQMRHAAVVNGRYQNVTGDPRFFVTAYFHRPEDLIEELTETNFRNAQVFGVEGPGWLVPDFEARWADARLRQELLEAARLLEREPSVVGVSAHLLAFASR
jgi:SAM-dependent methyltransferase